MTGSMTIKIFTTSAERGTAVDEQFTGDDLRW